MTTEPVVALRSMRTDDLEVIGAWLREPHVACWWTTPAEEELGRYRREIDDAHPHTMLLVAVADGFPIGWCQWYRWDDDADEAAAVGAGAGEVGIDYAIGEPGYVGRGVGTAMIAALVGEIRARAGDVAILSTPAAANIASRRVLEKNGFVLVGVRPLATERTDEPMALYRYLPTEG